MTPTKKISCVLYYMIGGAAWFLLLGILKASCIINIPLFIDGLWLKPVADGLEQNLIGATAFRVEGYGCDDTLIFVAPYYSRNKSDESEMKSLTNLIDLKTWKKEGEDTVSTTYSDQFNQYVLLQNSDGVDMKVYKK